MKALIDGDILVYRIGYTTQNEDWPIAKWRLNELLDRIINTTQATSFDIYLSDSTQNNFRYNIYKAYKANRTQPKPKHYHELKEYLVVDLNSKITAEQEADDAMGIEQSSYPEDSVICTIDKDLDQISGNHYNFVKDVIYQVDKQKALKFFYKQLLQGDSIDNIPGIPRVGPKTAEKLLKEVSEENDMFSVCLKEYEKHSMSVLDMYLTGLLIKIRTKRDELWTFPKTFQSLQPKMEELLSYSQTKAEEVMAKILTASSEQSSTEKEKDGVLQHGQ